MVASMGCENEKIQIQTVSNVSFSKNVIPIFNQSCNTSTSCHAKGGIAPDLSAANAWGSLINGGYVSDSLILSNNTLFQQINSKAMPPGTKLLQQEQDTANIFTWIRKGYRDN